MTALAAAKNPLPSRHTRQPFLGLASLLSVLAISATLIACGGGGGDSSPVVTPPDVPDPTPMPDPPSTALPELPLQRAQDSANSPILYVDRNLHVGADVAPPAHNLQQSALHRDITVSHGTLADGVGEQQFAAYLTADAQAYPSDIFLPVRYIHRFASPPTVRLAEGTSSKLTDLTVRALQMINAALPPHWQLRIDPTPGPADPDAFDNPPPGQILIQFLPLTQWPSRLQVEHAGGVAHAFATVTEPTTPDGTPTVSITKAATIIDHTRQLARPPGIQHPYTLEVLLHEILHTLGRSHAKPAFPDQTIMTSPSYLRHILFPLDREALLAVYSRLRPGSTVASLAEDLGPWSDTSVHLLGEFSAAGEDVSFGVALRNGLAQPWATGPAPLTNLTDNAAISGSASWSGRLLGFTPEAEPVAGAADLTIALDTLDGDLEFTELEHWTAGRAPGPAESGTMWDDGDLSYAVEVRGNTFTRTAGDEGIVTGAFLGAEHQAMGGTLQRDDLSAAFGGAR